MGKLKDKSSKATFRYKDIEIVMDNAALGERDDLAEGLIGPVDPAAADDGRLALPPEGSTQSDEIKARLDALEKAAVDSIVTLRVFALPQHVCERALAAQLDEHSQVLNAGDGWVVHRQQGAVWRGELEFLR